GPSESGGRGVEDRRWRIAEDGRDPDDLEVRRVHKDEHCKAIVRIGVAAVTRGIRIDPYTRRPVHVRSTAHQRQWPILRFAGPPISNGTDACEREQSRGHEQQRNPHSGERLTIWLHRALGYTDQPGTTDNPNAKDASKSQRSREGGAGRSS